MKSTSSYVYMAESITITGNCMTLTTLNPLANIQSSSDKIAWKING